MRVKYLLFICIVFTVGVGLKAQPYCDFIRKVRNYQDSVKLKEIYENECEVPVVDTATFDINVYLGLFDKLRLDLDLSPTVSLDSENCTITWYEIFTHRGIFKKTYKIERDYPYQIMEVAKEEIAEMFTTVFY